METVVDVLVIIAAFLVGVVGTARLTRLLTQDTYPPAAWVRSKWEGWTSGTGWEDLVTCPYCAAPYIALVNGAVGWATDWHVAWWAFNIWLTVAYLASMVVIRDGE